MLKTLILGALCTCYGIKATALGIVADNDLLHDIKTKQYVITLFTTINCHICDEFETALINVQDDLADSLSASIVTVKVVNSQILQLYSPSKEPTLIFFRNGIPLLYDGAPNGEEILTTLIENKEPIVRELTDENFEHLTQVSTGATTGDWFVMFYSTDCFECQHMVASWEAVGAKLKQHKNVARINMYTTGASTARRFKILNAPEFILFRQGKMYRYQIRKYDVSSFVSFAKDWWKNAHSERVPLPQSPFDDLVQLCVHFLQGYPWIMKLGSITICVLVIVSAASQLRRKSEAVLKKD